MNLRQMMLASHPSESMRKFEEMIDAVGTWKHEALLGLIVALKIGSVARLSDKIAFEYTTDDGEEKTFEIRCDEDETEALITRLTMRAGQVLAKEMATGT